MNPRALTFAVLLAGSVTFGQATQRHSIPAMAGGSPVTAVFAVRSCAGNALVVDGGCTIQLRKLTEADPSGLPRTINLTSEPLTVACGQTAMIHKCPFACTCPEAPKQAAPAPKNPKKK